jgi:hypothetical protein
MNRCEPFRHLSRRSVVLMGAAVLLAAVFVGSNVWSAVAAPDAGVPTALPADALPPAGVDLSKQTDQEAGAKSIGCMACHKDTHDPHQKETLHLGCTDCHGGDATAKDAHAAHVQPRFPEAWRTSAKPVRSYTLLNHETPEFVRFVNPGDLRVAHISCGTVGCHGDQVGQVRKSMMAHGCMLWGAALYNNGALPNKRCMYGESYSENGSPQRLVTVPPPTEDEYNHKGVVPFLDPLPRFEISQPGNVLRIFERGGMFRPETGIPNRFEDPGRPILSRLSNRGLGTENRTDPTVLGLQKTRLLDPTLNFMGTNDHAGDYRSSGCTACHVVYANDRSVMNAGPYAKFGNKGLSFSKDPTIPKDESGHPIDHRFTPGNAVPTSQCIVCHMHPGTNVLNTYLGMMWWDEETDGELIYPPGGKHLTAEQFTQSTISNPNESAARSNLSDPAFLDNLRDLNKETKHTQFADFHGHGWAFRAVFRQDRKGRFLDHDGKIIENVGNAELQAAMRFQDQKPKDRVHQPGVPVHMMDIHLEKGMHCADCHFVQDVHGNNRIQDEVRAGCEIQCIDCHGTVSKRATLRTSGPASYTSSPEGGRNLEAMRTPSGKRRFEREGDKVFQNSMVEDNLRWEVIQTADTVDPTNRNKHYNAKSAIAKTVRFEDDGKLAWGDLPKEGEKKCAHANENMSCIACHSSWNASCFGCHLPQKANRKTPMLHNDGDVTRNAIAYNFQTLRDDVYMLARDGNATGHRIGPARSSCAIHVGSYNQNRESIYFQQQTISGEGLSGIAFSSNVPHTVRGSDGTKQCADCHVSKKDDNNAIMAQLLMHGTNYLNFIGRYCWVAAGEHGFEAVEVTERDEPQAVIGSHLHGLAFPQEFCKHEERGRRLEIAHEHPGKDIGDQFFHPRQKPEILSVQARGEYLYAACGTGGLRVFDIAFLDDKGFSERVSTAPVSPLGQRFFVDSKYATAVAAPVTTAPDPTRKHRDENHEPAVHAMYGEIFVTDKYEGLIEVGAGTLLDGNPLNNFLKRDLTYNPDGLLCGANAITIVGTYAYICCDAGLVVVSVDDPKKPKVTAVVNNGQLVHPHATAVQFRYGYVCDDEGIKVLDTTDLAHPRVISAMKMEGAYNIYLARTYAYVAGGRRGLVILDIEHPEQPRVDQVFDGGGCINDLRDVKLGITYASEFAYLADGKNGMRVVQMTSPETPGNNGFSPRPTPELIATYKLPEGGCALAISKGLDRDRAVDESGHQTSVFGRVGAGPLSLEDQHKLYLRPDGKVWKVSDDPEDEEYKRAYHAPARK